MKENLLSQLIFRVIEASLAAQHLSQVISIKRYIHTTQINMKIRRLSFIACISVIFLSFESKGWAQSPSYHFVSNGAEVSAQAAKVTWEKFKVEKDQTKRNELATSASTQASQAISLFGKCSSHLNNTYKGVMTRDVESYKIEEGKPNVSKSQVLTWIASDLRYVDAEVLKSKDLLFKAKQYLQESYTVKAAMVATVTNVTMVGEPFRRHQVTPHFTTYKLNVEIGLQGDLQRRDTVYVKVVNLKGAVLGSGQKSFRAGENKTVCEVGVEIFKDEEVFVEVQVTNLGLSKTVPGKSESFSLGF